MDIPNYNLIALIVLGGINALILTWFIFQVINYLKQQKNTFKVKSKKAYIKKLFESA